MRFKRACRRLHVIDLVTRLGRHRVINADSHVLRLIVPALKDEHRLRSDVEAVDKIRLPLIMGQIEMSNIQ